MRQEASSAAAGNWTEEEKGVRLEELNQEAFSILLPTVVFCVVLMTIGIPGNILVFLVYLTQFRSSSTRVFIMVISVCDLCTSLISLLFMIYNMRHMYKTNGGSYCGIISAASHFPIVMSNSLLICMAFDRWRRVCVPVEWQLNARHAGQLVVVCFIVNSFLVLLLTFLYEDRKVDTKYAGLQGTICHFSSAYYKRVYGTFLLVYTAILLVLVGFAYGSIIVRFYQQDNKFPYIQRLTKGGSSSTNPERSRKESHKKMSQGRKISDADVIEERSEKCVTRCESIHLKVDPYADTSKSITKISPTSAVSPRESVTVTATSLRNSLQPSKPAESGVNLSKKHSTANTSRSTKPNAETHSLSLWFSLVDNLKLEKRAVTYKENLPKVPSFQPYVQKTKISADFILKDHILASKSTATFSSSPNSSKTINTSRDGKSLWSLIRKIPLPILIATLRKDSCRTARSSNSVVATDILVSPPANTPEKVFAPKKSILLTKAPLFSTRKSVRSPRPSLDPHDPSDSQQPSVIISTEISSVGSTNRRRSSRKPKARRNLLPFTTLMMLVMTTISIILHIPYIIVALGNTYYADVRLGGLKLNMVFLARVCIATNSVLNIIVYSVCNANFTSACRTFFRQIIE